MEVRESPFQLGRARCEDRGRIGNQDASRISQHRASVRVVRNAVRGDEHLDIRRAQLVHECGLEDLVLLLHRQHG